MTRKMTGTLPAPVSVAEPRSSDVLWRFMSLAKLLDMLQRNALYLTRVDKLLTIDPFEGSIPRRYEAERIAKKRFKPTRLHKLRVSPDAILDAARIRAQMHKQEREQTFVSCWYCGDQDSDAMWRRSGFDGDGSVAVRTTAGLLSDALPDWAYLGRVSYKDYETEVFPTSTCWSAFFHKRECFAHEKEVRVVVKPRLDDIGQEVSPDDAGLSIPIKMNAVLTAIHVSPAAPAWFLEVVARAAQGLGFNCPVKKSPMDMEPAF